MHSVSDPSRVRFSGPLTMFAGGLADELAALGFATTSATNKLRLAAHLSRWLDAAGLGLGELTPVVISQFLDDRRRIRARCIRRGPWIRSWTTYGGRVRSRQ